MEANNHYPAIKLLGVSVHSLAVPQLIEIIASSIVRGERRIIANHNLHSIYIYHHCRKMRAFYDAAAYVFVDGMSLVLAGKFHGYALTRRDRLTYLDWMPFFLKSAEKNEWKIFYLGSKPGIAEKGAEILRAKYPKLRMVTRHGHFDASPQSEDTRHVVLEISKYRPHVLIAGMGMPRQEHWVIDCLQQLDANVILNAGAYMDYIAGEISTPPRWLGQMGLEWLCRLAAEPGRLWRRYLVEPWFIARLLFREVIRPSENRP